MKQLFQLVEKNFFTSKKRKTLHTEISEKGFFLTAIQKRFFNKTIENKAFFQLTRKYVLYLLDFDCTRKTRQVL